MLPSFSKAANDRTLQLEHRLPVPSAAMARDAYFIQLSKKCSLFEILFFEDEEFLYEQSY
jgi:hypothetical protein